MANIENKKVINGELRTLTHDCKSYYKLKEGTQHSYIEELIKKSDIVEEYKPIVNGISSMSNGSPNKNINFEDIILYDSYTRRHLLWCMIVGTKEDFKTIKNYSEITGSLENIKEIYFNYKKSQNQDKENKRIKEQKEGAEAYNFARGKSFNLDFNFNINHAIGYLKEQGSWNDFNLKTAIPSLIKLDETAPTRIKDVNNPNYCIKDHVIKILKNGAYIVFSWDYIGSIEQLNDVKNWFESSRKYKNIMHADNYRIETEEHYPLGKDNKMRSYSAEVVFWWD